MTNEDWFHTVNIMEVLHHPKAWSRGDITWLELNWPDETDRIKQHRLNWTRTEYKAERTGSYSDGYRQIRGV